MKQPLTDKELEVLACMRDFFRANDMPPPLKTISEALDISFSTVMVRQRGLEAKGWIQRNAVGKYRFAREGAQA
jgi:Mn-dependent DtxR family transcriptional regulator